MCNTSCLLIFRNKPNAKMLRRVTPLASLVLLMALTVQADEEATNTVLESPVRGERTPKFGSTPTLLIADMARQLITQSYSNSQVLSLNLSNVLILLLLKAVLFSIGHFGLSQNTNKGYGGGSGFGGSGGGWWGRADPDSQPRVLPDADNGLPVTEGELLLALGYLNGERRGDYSCLYHAACVDHSGRAVQYLQAGRMLLKTANVVSSVFTINPKYSAIVDGFEDAVKFGLAQGDCAAKYRCTPDTNS
ncbi:hypothetical protein B566_EDAN009650 [Ephemera danica]|nr:hypothetical protein B566_EDAN009650 [Ephemera danica]